MCEGKEVNLQPIWNVILDIYDEVAKICDRHRIRYWGAAGTLLGAVRHQGFIPWDDDFDLHMPRVDYDRFIEIANRELPPHYKIISRQNTREYNWNFIKIQDCRKDVYECVVAESGVEQEHGIYIDIFPLYGVSGSKLIRLWEQVKFLLVKTRMTRVLRSGKHSSVKGWLAEAIGWMLWIVFPNQRTEHDFIDLIEKWNGKIPFDGSRYVSLFWLQLMNWEWIAPRSAFDSTVMLQFGNVKIPAPAGYDKTLTAHYGDYMKLPPIEQRKSCHNGWGDAPWKFGPTGN